jgi:hypothetical protein
MQLPREILGGDLTPLNSYEAISCSVPATWYDKQATHQLVEVPGRSGVRPLCMFPDAPNYGSSLPPIQCVRCQEIWHYRVTPDSIREKLGLRKNCFTKIMERIWCGCSACEEIEPYWVKYGRLIG